MRERPILFSAPMVRAILEGRKTQTRREVKPQPDFLGSMSDVNTPFKTLGAGLHARIECPYGQPGDRLWVREAWGACDYFDNTAPRDLPDFAAIKYFADDAIIGATAGYGLFRKARPFIHMPRSLSRITLEIVSIRVERLSDISREDAEAEGVGLKRVSDNDYRWIDYADKDGGRTVGDPRHSFWSLWKSINGTSSFDANPWVWCVEFKRVIP